MVVFPAPVHDANHLRSNNAADQAPSLLIGEGPFISSRWRALLPASRRHEPRCSDLQIALRPGNTFG
jgi:hypothetical protein